MTVLFKCGGKLVGESCLSCCSLMMEWWYDHKRRYGCGCWCITADWGLTISVVKTKLLIAIANLEERDLVHCISEVS